MTTAILTIGGFFLVLALLVIIRARTGDKSRIGNSDIIVALIPVLIALLFSGKVEELTIGDVKVALAVREAAKLSIAPEVAKVPVKEVVVGRSETLVEITQYIEQRTAAVSFRMARYTRGGRELIVSYLERLTPYPFLRHVLVNDPDGSFFGMADAQEVAALNRAPDSPFSFEKMARWLLEADRERLRTLPGFVAVEDAIPQTADKATALKRMNALNRSVLPVVGGQGRFEGVLGRDALTASLLTDILDALKGEERR